MSGKSAKKLRRVARSAMRINYDKFMREVRELDFVDRVNISLALILKTNDVWKGQSVLWIFLILLFALGCIFSWLLI